MTIQRGAARMRPAPPLVTVRSLIGSHPVSRHTASLRCTRLFKTWGFEPMRSHEERRLMRAAISAVASMPICARLRPRSVRSAVAMHLLRAANIKINMLGGASQIVRRIRIEMSAVPIQ